MAVAGTILLIVGFVLVVPRGSIAGSVAARNIGMRGHGVYRTPGYQAEPSRRARVWIILTGLLMIAVGFVLIAIDR